MANCWVGRHVSDPVSSIFSLSPTLALAERCVSSAKKSLKIWTIDTWKYTKILQTKKNSIHLNPCMIVFGKEIFSERNICFSNKSLGNIDKHIYVLAWHLKKKCSQSTLRSYVLVLPVVCMFIVQSKKLCAKQNEIVFNKPLGVANSSEANNIFDKLS